MKKQLSLKFNTVLMSIVLLTATLGYAYPSQMGPQPIIYTDIAKGRIFVKPGGSGTVCSKTIPCDLWQGISKAKAGDVVFLRGGIYYINKTTEIRSVGTKTAPIIFESYPGEKAILDGGKNSLGANVHFQLVGSFIHLRNLEVRSMPRYGVIIGGNDNLLEGLNVHHNKLSGIAIWSRTDIPYGAYGSRNIIRHNISAYNSGAGYNDSLYRNGNNSDGIAIDSGTANRIEHNLVHNNSDDGIDLWQSTNCYVAYNIVHSQGFGNGNGMGIKAGGAYPSSGSLVEHNMSYKNKRVGITYNTGKKLKIINNTTWGNGTTGYSVGADNIVSNNIASEAREISGTGIATNNSWQRSGTVVFISTDPTSTNFLIPAPTDRFSDIGALPLIKIVSTNVQLGPQTFVPTDLAKGKLFVKPDGSGTTCSQMLPCDIWQATYLAKGGDVVFLKGGTYKVSKTIKFSINNTAATPVIFESYPDTKASYNLTSDPIKKIGGGVETDKS